MSLQYSDAKVEVIDGIEIMMSPPAYSNHNRVKENVFHLFRNYLKGNICIPFGEGQKVVLPSQNKGDYLIPDFFVLCDRSKYRKDGVHGSPDLVVEVLSPKTAKMDRGKKKDLYQANGVKEYWIIEPDNKIIEIYLLNDGVYDLIEVYSVPDPDCEEPDTDMVTSFPVNLFPGMIIKLDDVFEYVISW